MLPKAFKARLSPVTIQEAIVRRTALATQVGSKKSKPPADVMLWVRSHIQRLEDQTCSALEESVLPWKEATNDSSGRTLGSYRSGTTSDASVFTFREFPMYPGEYIPAGHKSLASMRDNLTQDLLAQNIKTAWMSVTRGDHFASPGEFYRRADGLDESRLVDIVGALYPSLDVHDSRALIRKTLETISTDSNTLVRVLNRAVTAESVGLDNSPQHYTNFLEWMARLMDTVGFKTEHAISMFCRKKFNSYDARIMYENHLLMGNSYLSAARVDGYTHYYTILRDFIQKITAVDTRAQIGVRIDPPEMDPRTGLAIGWGLHKFLTVIAMVRENKDGTGSMYIHGEPLNVYMRDQSWWMELLLQPFDDAGVSYKDFDVYLSSEMTVPRGDNQRLSRAGRIAIAMALTKLMPITRIHLKKAGLLSFSRKYPWGHKPGMRGFEGKNKKRFFKKR